MKSLIMLLSAVLSGAGFGTAMAAETIRPEPAIHVAGDTQTRAAARLLRRGAAERALPLLSAASASKRPSVKAVALNNLCAAQTQLGHFEAAAAACDAAITVKSDYWQAYVNRANLHFARHAYGPALADYEAAIRLNPGDNLIKNNISIVQNEQNSLAIARGSKN